MATLWRWCLIVMVGLGGCFVPPSGQGGDDDDDGGRDRQIDTGNPNQQNNPGAPSNLARFTFDCDLNGANGLMTMDVEAIDVTGVVFGPGPNPSITGVIGTGEVTLVTAGEVVSDVARYIFTGRDQFADFTELGTYYRFRVEWVPVEAGLVMVVNPFGPGPAEHLCVLTSARYL